MQLQSDRLLQDSLEDGCTVLACWDLCIATHIPGAVTVVTCAALRKPPVLG